MKKYIMLMLLMTLSAGISMGASLSWTFDADTTPWDSPPTTWNTTIAHSASEGNVATGALQATDADTYFGVRVRFTLGGNGLAYETVAWVKIVSIDASNTIAMGNFGISNEPAATYDGGLIGTWQTQSITGTTDTSIFAGDGFIMLYTSTGASPGAPATIEYFVDDVEYIEGSSVDDWGLY